MASGLGRLGYGLEKEKEGWEIKERLFIFLKRFLERISILFDINAN